MNALLPSTGVIETLANERCSINYSWEASKQVLSAWVGIFSTLRLPFCFMSLHNSLFQCFCRAPFYGFSWEWLNDFWLFNGEPGCGTWQGSMWQQRCIQLLLSHPSSFKSVSANSRKPLMNERIHSHGSLLFRFGRNTTWVERWNNI